MVIAQFVFEWFAGRNCIILPSQIPVLQWHLHVAVKLDFWLYNNTSYACIVGNMEIVIVVNWIAKSFPIDRNKSR